MARSKGVGLASTTKAKTRPSSTPRIVTPRKGTEEHFRAQSDMNTLRQAEEIKADPKRMRVAKNMAKSEAQTLAKVGAK